MGYMKRTASVLLLVLCVLALTPHVRQSAAVTRKAGKPTVCLTIERLAGDGSVWLRLHNDTKWAISFRTEQPYDGAGATAFALGDGRVVYGLADNLEVAPEYFIEHATDRVTTVGRGWCTSVASWLPPGRSVLFSFPRESIKPWEQLYVRFTYEWEQSENEPEHQVKFYGSSLRGTE
jgi:hypothetical protein